MYVIARFFILSEMFEYLIKKKKSKPFISYSMYF